MVHDFQKMYQEVNIFFAAVHECTKRVNKAYKNICVPKFTVHLTLNLPSCGLVVFIDMNRYILTEGSNFKTFLKDNYAVALEDCYLFAKKV